MAPKYRSHKPNSMRTHPTAKSFEPDSYLPPKPLSSVPGRSPNHSIELRAGWKSVTPPQDSYSITGFTYRHSGKFNLLITFHLLSLDISERISFVVRCSANHVYTLQTTLRAVSEPTNCPVHPSEHATVFILGIRNTTLIF